MPPSLRKEIHIIATITPSTNIPGSKLGSPARTAFTPFYPTSASWLNLVDRFYRAPGLGLPQYPNDLLLAESTSLHVLLLLFEQNSSYVELFGVRH
jgi:hypothetical protein